MFLITNINRILSAWLFVTPTQWSGTYSGLKHWFWAYGFGFSRVSDGRLHPCSVVYSMISWTSKVVATHTTSGWVMTTLSDASKVCRLYFWWEIHAFKGFAPIFCRKWPTRSKKGLGAFWVTATCSLAERVLALKEFINSTSSQLAI